MYTFPVMISLCDYLSFCLCVFTWQKIDQAGRPETFFNFAWPNSWFIANCIKYYLCLMACGLQFAVNLAYKEQIGVL